MQYRIIRLADGVSFILVTNPIDRPSFAYAGCQSIPLTFENAERILSEAFSKTAYEVEELS